VIVGEQDANLSQVLSGLDRQHTKSSEWMDADTRETSAVPKRSRFSVFLMPF
jgi:hypothetical protein